MKICFEMFDECKMVEVLVFYTHTHTHTHTYSVAQKIIFNGTTDIS